MSNQDLVNQLSIHQFASTEPGTKFLVLGAVHGNETCGTKAINRIRKEIEEGLLKLSCGTLTLVPVANPLAFSKQQRNGERNLNRSMRITEEPEDYEDKLANILCPLMQQHDVLLDLHSSHTPGLPFALFGPENNQGEIEPFAKAAQEEALAKSLGVTRLVEGWLETYAAGAKERSSRGATADVEFGVGTTECMRHYGGIAITLECGQHDEPQAEDVAYRAILRSLLHLHMIDVSQHTPVCEAETLSQDYPLTKKSLEVMKLYRVIDKLHQDDTLQQDWQDFSPIKQGEVIAQRADGTKLLAEKDGWIVFPNADAQLNEEWYFLAEPSFRLAD